MRGFFVAGHWLLVIGYSIPRFLAETTSDQQLATSNWQPTFRFQKWGLGEQGNEAKFSQFYFNKM